MMVSADPRPERRSLVGKHLPYRGWCGSERLASQVMWHLQMFGNPTLADAILDRIVHNAYRVELSGESLRKPRASA